MRPLHKNLQFPIVEEIIPPNSPPRDWTPTRGII